MVSPDRPERGASRGEACLQVDGVRLSLSGHEILRGLTLRAESGRVTAVLGPNGAGKTTLLRCCTGLLRPGGGTVRVLGDPPGAVATSGRVGVMPQSTGAWSGIRAGELLRYLATLYAHPLPVDTLMRRLRLDAAARTPYRRLSGGQQQAVNLAGAVIGRPELVFLDEPTAGMDPHARHGTWELIRDLRAGGVTVILTTHAMDEAAELADKVVLVDGGRDVLAGSVPELTADGSSLEELFLTHTSGGA